MRIKAHQVNPEAYPLRHRQGDGGIDVAIPHGAKYDWIGPNTLKVALGWRFELEEGWHLLALQKSRHGGKMTVEAPLIDNSYRGEVHAVLTFTIAPDLEPGDYVLQLFPVHSPEMVLEITEELSQTERGDGAFGSTMEKRLGESPGGTDPD